MRNRGLSLIEVIVYIAVLSALTIIVITAFLSFSKIYSELAVSRLINTSASSSMDRILRESRSAISIDTASSTLGTSPGVLVLNKLDDQGLPTTVSFYSDGDGDIHVSIGTTYEGVLTQKAVSVPSLIFERVPANRSELVKVSAQFSASRGSSSKTKTFYGSIVLRGGY